MNDINEREWEAQELARKVEQHGIDPPRDDGRVRRYRLIARALRNPPAATLPDDFAEQIAAQVVPSRDIPSPAGGGIESALAGVLGGVLLVLAGGVLAHGERDWIPAIRAALGTADWAAIHWSLAFAGCIGLSWLLGLMLSKSSITTIREYPSR